MPKSTTIEVINIGDELLVGIRENAHLTYLGDWLARYGRPIRRARIISDEVDEIKRAFTEAWRDSDIVITTGGLGPTTDDLTRESIAEALGYRGRCRLNCRRIAIAFHFPNDARSARCLSLPRDQILTAQRSFRGKQDVLPATNIQFSHVRPRQ